MRLIPLISFILLSSSSFTQNIEPLWFRAEPTEGTTDYNLPSVMVDTFDNVIMTGTTYNPGPNLGFITVKYDSNGNKIWERTHDLAGTDRIRASDTDAAGAVYVGGNTTRPLVSGGQFLIFKYGTNGDTLWQYYHDVPAGISTSLTDLMVDDQQRVTLFGQYSNGTTEFGLLAVQLSQDGNIIWSSTYSEPGKSFGGLDVRWIGDRWAFWGGNNGTSGPRFFVWQIGSEGQTLGSAETVNYNDYFNENYHIDASGNLYIGDEIGEYRVTKFSLNGEWEWEYKKPTAVFEFPVLTARLKAIETNALGEVFASGLVRIDSNLVIAVTSKLDQSGALIWEHEVYYPDSEGTYSHKSAWIGDKLLVGGTIRPESDSNYYEYFFTLYDTDGFIKWGVSDLEGRNNAFAEITTKGNHFYAVGTAFPIILLDTIKTIICKYALSDLVTSTEPTNPSINLVSRLRCDPNPFGDYLQVSFDHNGKAAPANLTLTNAQGSTIWAESVQTNTGSNTLRLQSMAQVPAGVYLLTLGLEGQQYTVKVVKQ